MPDRRPEPNPEQPKQQPTPGVAPGSPDGPTFGWAPGPELPGVGLASGEVPPETVNGAGGGGGPTGLDWQVLLEALAAGGFLDGRAEDQDAEMADELAARDDGRMGPPLSTGQVAALAVEHMDPGPAQAGWLGAALAEAKSLDEYGLAGVTIASHALTSWAQSTELTAVAQITSRAAAADTDIRVAADGRPGRVCRDALGQVRLALRMDDYRANWWADLAVTLSWRLPDTGAALQAGRIDLDRAKAITEATSLLSEDLARVVEAAILPYAGKWTLARLRYRLRKAVIAADPEGAERRRQDAERSAQVRLYADDDGTATLTGSKLPAVEAAAAMARITAIARAMKAAGQAGGLDVHRAKAMLGLLLGTLPYIPPADGAPPDPPPSSDDPGPSRGGHGRGGPSRGDHGPGDHSGAPRRPDGGADDAGPASPGGGPRDDPHRGPGGAGPGRDGSADSTGRIGPGQDSGADSGGRLYGPTYDGPDDLPAPGDEDAPAEDGLVDQPDLAGQRDPAEDDDLTATGPVPWPALGMIPPALARPTPEPGRPVPELQPGRPVPGLLDVTLPWTTLTGLDHQPGLLGRIGPITAHQARQLASAAEGDPAAQWRVIVTNPAGQAIAVTRLRRPGIRAGPGPARGDPGPARGAPRPARDSPLPGTGLVGRIALVISQDTIRDQVRAQKARAQKARAQKARAQKAPAQGPPARGGVDLAGIAVAALRAAGGALEWALAQAEADAAAGGCAHAEESPGYRPPPRLREYVIARDVTCRNPVCRRPAWRADLDHTIPYERHGRTCKCNLGGACRRDHQLKQHPRWKVEQTRPGEFTWTTPAGRAYTSYPDSY
jgi:Domain of unknown function (DUF222)